MFLNEVIFISLKQLFIYCVFNILANVLVVVLSLLIKL